MNIERRCRSSEADSMSSECVTKERVKGGGGGVNCCKVGGKWRQGVKREDVEGNQEEKERRG